MAENLGTAVLELRTRNTRFKAGLRRAEQSAKKAGKTMTKFLTLPLAVLGFSAGRSAARFGDAMNKVVSLTALTRDEVTGLTDELLQLGPAVGKAPQELAEALFPIASAGNDATQSMANLTAAAMASAAGFGTTQDAANALNKTMASFRGEVFSSAEAMGVLIATASEADALPDALALPISRFIPFAKAAGIELRTILAEFALVTRGAGSAEEASTAMVGAINAISKPANIMREVIKKAGLPLAELRKILAEDGIIAAVDALKVALGDGTQEFDDFFANIRGGLAVNILLATTTEEVSRTMGVLADSGVGNLMDAFTEATKSPMFRFRQGLAQLNSLMITFGNAVLPVVIPIMRQITDQLSRLSIAFRKLSPEVQRNIIRIAGMTALAGPLLLVVTFFGKAMVSLVGFVLAGTLKIATAFFVMSRAVIVNIIEMIAVFGGAPVALGLIVVAMGTALLLFPETVKAVAEAAANNFKLFFLTEMKLAANDAVRLINVLAARLTQLGELAQLKKPTPLEDLIDLQGFDEPFDFKNILQSQIDLKTELAKGWKRIKGAASRDMAKLGNALEDSFNTIVSTLKGVLPDGVMELLFPDGLEQTELDLAALMDSLGALPNQLGDLGDAGGDVAEAFGNMGDEIASSISAATTDAIVNLKSLADFANSVLQIIFGALVQQAIGIPVGNFFGKIFGGGGKAEGGPVGQGRSFLVGEEGPERFVPNRSGTIIPNDQLGRGSGGGDVVMNIQAGLPAQILQEVRNVAAEVGTDAAVQIIRRAVG